jgi:hypothetical protein
MRSKEGKRKNLAEQIAETESKPQHETVAVPLRMLRSLYLHALLACRDRDYSTVSQYVSDLIRKDKRVALGSPPPNR